MQIGIVESFDALTLTVIVIQITKKPLKQGEKLSRHLVLDEVAKFNNTSVEKIIQKTRKREIVEMRHIYMTFCEKFVNVSLYKIASLVNLDHSTVLYAKRRIKNKYDLKPDFEKFVQYMEERYKLKEKRF